MLFEIARHAGADSDEAGHLFRFEAGHRSDLKAVTRGSLPRIEAMMFRDGGEVKRRQFLSSRGGENPVGWRWAKRASAPSIAL
jgi:hypothetical protein